MITDTFQASEDTDTIDDTMFTTNTERGLRQLELDIRVIVGNPPYSVGQTSENDANQNLKYPTLDASIENLSLGGLATNGSATGNGSANAIRGNTTNNYLAGLAGNVVATVNEAVLLP